MKFSGPLDSLAVVDAAVASVGAPADADAAGDADVDAGSGSGGGASGDAGGAATFTSFTLAGLKAMRVNAMKVLLKERGLVRTGRKQELFTRLAVFASPPSGGQEQQMLPFAAADDGDAVIDLVSSSDEAAEAASPATSGDEAEAKLTGNVDAAIEKFAGDDGAADAAGGVAGAGAGAETVPSVEAGAGARLFERAEGTGSGRGARARRPSARVRDSGVIATFKDLVGARVVARSRASLGLKRAARPDDESDSDDAAGGFDDSGAE